LKNEDKHARKHFASHGMLSIPCVVNYANSEQ